jgi:hypothetical protein
MAVVVAPGRCAIFLAKPLFLAHTLLLLALVGRAQLPEALQQLMALLPHLMGQRQQVAVKVAAHPQVETLALPVLVAVLVVAVVAYILLAPDLRLAVRVLLAVITVEMATTKIWANPAFTPLVAAVVALAGLELLVNLPQVEMGAEVLQTQLPEQHALAAVVVVLGASI